MKTILLILLYQGVLMSAVIKYLEINGTKIPLIFEQDKTLPIKSLSITFKNSGYIFDKKESLSNLTSKLLNKGTKKNGYIEFSNRLENSAISLNSYFSSENFYFFLESLKDNFDYGLELFEHLILDPNFDEKTLKSLKDKEKGRLKQLSSDFSYLAAIQLKKMIYKNTPLEQTAIGNSKSIDNISMIDIKNKISSYLVLKNMIITIGGDLTVEEAIKYGNKIISLFKIGQASEERFISMAERENQDVERTTLSSEQAYINFASPLLIKVNSKDRHFAKVASFILGSSGFGSRLMEEIRVKQGLAYSIYSSFNIEKSHSYFSGFLQTKITNEEKAITSIIKLIKNFIINGVTEEELISAKEFIIGSQALKKETLSNRLNIAFNDFYRNSSLTYFDEQINLVKNMKLLDLNKFILSHKEILNLSFSVVTGKVKK